MLARILEARYGDPRTFIMNVRLWMTENHITQQVLADEMGLDMTNINRWMNHRIIPSLRTMLLMDVSIERIIERSNTP